MKSTQFFYNVQGDEGAQIDLLNERSDRVVNLCEMKFYQREYLALEGELFIGDEKMNIGAENMNINVQINSIKGRTLFCPSAQKVF